MGDTLADWIATGVDLGISAAILVCIVTVLNMAYKGNVALSRQQAISDSLWEYREYNQFDNTVVYPQDVVSAIFRYRGEPAIKVFSSKGSYTWTQNSKPCEWTTAAINNLIDQTKVYSARVEKNSSGQIVSIVFVAGG